MTNKKKIINEWIDNKKDKLISIADKIFDYAEPSMKEVKSSKLLADWLIKEGFEVEMPVGGVETAFRAEYTKGEGGPRIGILVEYDALEDIGHACSHHLQGPTGIACALAIKNTLKEESYSLIVYGTPAEEAEGGKIIMQQNGCFKDIDFALMSHGSPTTGTDEKCMALENFKVHFKGKSSHAAIAPEEGRSAFDAVLLSFQAIEFMREHVKDDTRMHYTVLNAGGPPNVVPGESSAEYTLRSYDTDYLNTVKERFMDIIKGACLMTGTTCTIERDLPFKSKIPSPVLDSLLMENAKEVEAPCIRPPREKTGSTDFGNVMYEIPGSCIRVAFVKEGTAAHSKDYLDAGKSEDAHNAIIYGAKIMAGACIDIIENPELLSKIKDDFYNIKYNK